MQGRIGRARGSLRRSDRSALPGSLPCDNSGSPGRIWGFASRPHGPDLCALRLWPLGDDRLLASEFGDVSQSASLGCGSSAGDCDTAAERRLQTTSRIADVLNMKMV